MAVDIPLPEVGPRVITTLARSWRLSIFGASRPGRAQASGKCRAEGDQRDFVRALEMHSSQGLADR